MSKAYSLTPSTSPLTVPMTDAMWAGGGAYPVVWVHPTGGNTIKATAFFGNNTIGVDWTPGTVAIDTTYQLTGRCDSIVFTLVSGTDTNSIVGVAGN